MKRNIKTNLAINFIGLMLMIASCFIIAISIITSTNIFIGTIKTLIGCLLWATSHFMMNQGREQ